MLRCVLRNTEGGLCAHGLCTLIQHVRVSVVVNQIRLLVGNQIEHCTAMSADTITATTGILIKGNKRKSISRTKTIKISKNSPKVHYPIRGSM